MSEQEVRTYRLKPAEFRKRLSEASAPKIEFIEAILSGDFSDEEIAKVIMSMTHVTCKLCGGSREILLPPDPVTFHKGVEACPNCGTREED
jgi:hypothetical protein